MWEMFIQSASLFLKGKMFRDPKQVLVRSTIGVVGGAVLLIILGKFLLPLWAAAGIAGVITGAMMPYMFKDLKYQ